MRLAGKAGVVTGAGSGLGREVVLVMTAEGASIVAVDLNQKAVQHTVSQAVAGGGTALAHVGDVAREEDIADAIRLCREQFGGFDLIHNNAGVQVEARLHDTTEEQWDVVNNVNLKGVFWGCKQAVIAMRETGGGSIVNTASILALTGDALLPAYTATKTGVLGLSRSIAIDYAANEIRCNCVCPGDMDTPMLEKYFNAASDPVAARSQMEEIYPGKRIAHPREVAMAVLFLASDEASFVSGTYIIVDGGLTAKTY
jgi:NAD(P)-dependent dehydrogenase (short-subunit alcohol dehydrogenase family)